MSETTVDAATAAAIKPLTEAAETEATASKIPKGPTRSNIPTPAASVTGIPIVKQRAPSNFGSSNSISKIGRPCCTHATPKTGPPPRDSCLVYSRQ
ncbi:hypothetical protein ACLKA7_004464 [Drosophila subpalustris]